MERMQSTYENQVEFNLAESGVHPLRLGELVHDTAAREALLAEALRYTQTNGTPPLREQIASMYPGATADHVLVTNGGSEANFVAVWNLVEPGDEVVMMVPNYMQMWGLAQAFGATVSGVAARQRRRAVADRRGRSRARRLAADQADRHLQSEQPDRRAIRRRRSRSHRGGRGPPRQLGARRRDLPRRRARRPRNGDDVGAARSGDRHERALESVRAAGPAHRLGRRAAGARGVAVGVPRLHDDRARRA